MTRLKYQFYLMEFMEQLYALEDHVKPRDQRQITYFCRLCRKYGIKTRKSRLQNFHNANRDTVTKRSNNDLVEVIFIESK